MLPSRRLFLAGWERRGVGEVDETRQVRQVGTSSFLFLTGGNDSSAVCVPFLVRNQHRKKDKRQRDNFAITEIFMSQSHR